MCEGMVHREDDKGAKAVGHLEELDAVVAIGPVIEIGEHYAFWVARRARRIADGYRIIFVGIGGDCVEAVE